MNDEYIAAGYYAVQRVARPEGISTDVPVQMLTLSKCFADVAPHCLLNWTGHAWTEDLTERAVGFGIDRSRVQELEAWLNLVVTEPDAFPSLDIAKEFKRRFALDSGVLLLGLGLHDSLLPRFHEQRGDDVNHGNGMVERLELEESLASGGRPLGFEPLGYDAMSFHTWLCNFDPREVTEPLGIAMNERGFIDGLEDSVRLVQYLKDQHAEPAIWLPMLVVEYAD